MSVTQSSPFNELDLAPSFVVRLTTTVLHLPNEIIFLILHLLETDDLFPLALVCRRFNSLALHVCVSRYPLGDRLNVFANITTFRALCIMLLPPNFKSIYCQYPYSYMSPHPQDQFRRDIHAFHRLISRLSRVEDITIDHLLVDSLLHPEESWGLMEHHVETPEAWAQAFVPLLTTVVEKSTTLTIQFGRLRAPMPPEVSKVRQTPHHRFGIFRTTHSPLPAISTIKVQAFNIHSTMLLHHTLCSWTINTLNSSLVTRLTFEYIFTDPGIWTVFLQSLTLPFLLEVSFKACRIAFQDLVHFLLRHPRITTLCVFDTWDTLGMDGVNPTFGFYFLPRLTMLGVSANQQHLRLLTSRPFFCGLRTLAISVPAPYKEALSLSETDKLLSTIGRHLRKVTLLLKITAESSSAEWLGTEKCPSLSHLSRIHSLEITAGLGRLKRDVWIALPTWLTIFPALREVLLVDFKTYSREEPEQLEQVTKIAFVRLVGNKCGWIERVGFNGEVRTVGAWLAI